MTQDMNDLETLRKLRADLHAASFPTKSDVFVSCGLPAADARNAIDALLSRLREAEEDRDGWRRLCGEHQAESEAAEQALSDLKREVLEKVGPFAETAAVLGNSKDSAIWAGQKPAPPLTFGHFRALSSLHERLSANPNPQQGKTT